MKRRNFVQSLLVVPATTVVAESAAPAPQQPPAPATRPQTPARPAPGPAKLTVVTPPDAVSEQTTGFFTRAQFAALRHLAELLMPPMKNNPGALDAKAPEFLDFLISKSPAATKALYRNGLDGLNASATRHFHKPFAELDAKQADSIIRPLLVARGWDRTVPKEPMAHFMTQAHGDIRTATMNSAEWAASGNSSGRMRFNSGRRAYWKPIDPRVGA